MPVIQLKDIEQHKKAFRVLIRVGGTFQGRPGRVLAVTDQQYRALIRAGVIKGNGAKVRRSGKKTAQRSAKP